MAVDALFAHYAAVMTNLQAVLFQLRDKPLDEHLQQYRPPEMAPEQATGTLFDWVAIADVHRMQTEAFREMAAIKKLGTYLRMTVAKMDKKLTYMRDLQELMARRFQGARLRP